MSNVKIFLLVLFSTFLLRCENGPQKLSHQQTELASKVKNISDDYLVRNIGISGFNGKVFCSYKVLDIEIMASETVNEYLLAGCQEYYLRNGELKKGTGILSPVALYLKNENGMYKVINHKVPRDGAMYSYDVEQIFPKHTHAQIFSAGSDFNPWNELEKEAVIYYQSTQTK